jgi:hypothetical protein
VEATNANGIKGAFNGRGTSRVRQAGQCDVLLSMMLLPMSKRTTRPKLQGFFVMNGLV